MTNEQKQKVVAAIEAKFATGTSQNELSKMLQGVSSATLSQMKNGNHELISDAMWNKVAAYFRLANNDWQLVKTANFNTINILLADTQRSSRFIAISGFSGAGKTTSLRHYSEKNQNTYYVLCNVLMGRKDFLKAIMQSLGIDVDGSLIRRINAIIGKLRQQDEPLLILDDCGKLNDGNLKLIQLIYDELEGGCGIVMAGTDDMKRYIDKMAAKGKIGFPELKRRIAYWQRLYAPSREAVKSICNENGINDDAVIEYCYKHRANDYGTLRNSITMAKVAANGGAITIETIAKTKIGEHEFNN